MLAAPPVGGPEGSQQRLGAAAAGEAEQPAQEAEQNAAAARHPPPAPPVSPARARRPAPAASPQIWRRSRASVRRASSVCSVAELVGVDRRRVRRVDLQQAAAEQDGRAARCRDGKWVVDHVGGRQRQREVGGGQQEAQGVLDRRRLLGGGPAGAEATRPQPAAARDHQGEQADQASGARAAMLAAGRRSARGGRSPPRSRRAAKRGASGPWLPASPPRGRSVRTAKSGNGGERRSRVPPSLRSLSAWVCMGEQRHARVRRCESCAPRRRARSRLRPKEERGLRHDLRDDG